MFSERVSRLSGAGGKLPRHLPAKTSGFSDVPGDIYDY